jgi:hypothetical protein
MYCVEEDENTANHFKDVHSLVVSALCGYEGPESYGNKQLLFIGDERQIGAVQVTASVSHLRGWRVTPPVCVL